MTDDWHRGDWMQTYTGRKFYPFNPRPEEVSIDDIAHHLSMICRFGGATKFHYSVAQHSVLVAQHVKKENRLRALMHDAAEYITGDMVRPIKTERDMNTFRGLESLIEGAIARRFGLPFPIMNADIKQIDNRILLDERKHCLAASKYDWELPDIEPLGVRIDPWTPTRAKGEFIAAFEAYSQLAMFPEG